MWLHGESGTLAYINERCKVVTSEVGSFLSTGDMLKNLQILGIVVHWTCSLKGISQIQTSICRSRHEVSFNWHRWWSTDVIRVKINTQTAPHLLARLKQIRATVTNVFSSSEMISQGIISDVQLVYPITGRHSTAGGGPTDRNNSSRVKYNTELTGAT